MTKNLILWDLERKLEFTSDYTILWNSFSENKEKKIFSINNLIGKKEDYYKGIKILMRLLRGECRKPQMKLVTMQNMII